MEHYYETTHESGNLTITAKHATLEEAIEFAEANSIEEIHEIGGSFDDFAKCGFCGDWLPIQDLDDNGWCAHCEWYTTKGRC